MIFASYGRCRVHIVPARSAQPKATMTTASAPFVTSSGPEPLRRALAHLAAIQEKDGGWEGEVSWNPMVLAQYVFVRTIVHGPGGAPFDAATKRKMIRYFEVTRAADGGWGLHAASRSYVFFTTLAYVALRLLGVGPDEPITARARRFLRAVPDRVLSIPTWGKLWLSILGLYGYEGVNPISPELFLLPAQLPFHPNRYFCHTRYVYLGMAYLYGRRYRADLGPVAVELRDELHDRPFASIDFASHRHDIAASDLHVRPGLALRLAYGVLARWERAPAPAIRRRALDHCLSRIVYETRMTGHQGLCPVTALLNCLALHASDPAHPELAPSLAGLEACRWEDEAEGIRYAGARSKVWDTAFVMRAVLEAPASGRFAEVLVRAYDSLREAQVLGELEGREAEHRDRVHGGFCFAGGRHRWPVSDCTAEALSAILALHEDSAITPRGPARIADERLLDAARFILSRQNDDGGFASYERSRGSRLLEALNPSEMFAGCMTERSYVECTASCVTALTRLLAARGQDGLALVKDRERACISTAMERGVRQLRRTQRPDGAWPGFWGVNFTYATFHAVEALCAAGAGPSDPALVRARRWLCSTQKPDGGWGEHYTGCLEGRYVEHPESQAAMTAWALLALLSTGLDPRATPAARAAAWLAAKQRPDGAWPRQAPAGVFFGTGMLDYRLYKDYFSAWALARHAALSEREWRGEPRGERAELSDRMDETSDPKKGEIP